MKKLLVLGLGSVLFLLASCATHRDYLSTIEINGSLEMTPGIVPTLVLVDSGLDDVRSVERRVFYEYVIDNPGRFSVSATYFWGAKGRDRFSSANFEVRVEARGCLAFVRRVDIASLEQSGGTRILDLGVVDLKCNLGGSE